MKKITLLSMLALSVFALGACTAQQSSTTSQSSEVTQESEADVTEAVTKDAEVLLDAVLSTSSARFAKIYGDSYADWTDAIYEEQAAERIEEDELTPADTYTIQWHTDFEAETPEETITKFLQARRNMIQEIGTYEITDVVVDEDGETATVTFSSKKLHSKDMTASVRTVLTTLIGGLDNLGKYNTAGGASAEVKNLQNLLSYWIFAHLFEGDFTAYEDVSTELTLTPLTSGEFETEITLEKDEDDNWVISKDDYRILVTELIDDTEDYETSVSPEDL